MDGSTNIKESEKLALIDNVKNEIFLVISPNPCYGSVEEHEGCRTI